MTNLTPEFIPMSKREMDAIGWDALDILLITGDAYVDHPSFGAAVIGRVLLDAGFRVGIVAQPDWKTTASLEVFGRPEIGCAVTAGNLDSMLNIYTAGRRFRKQDVYAPGGKPGLRPPHAVTVYTQLAKRAFSGIPVVIGGIEASLRRLAHYDYWQDRIRQSALIDSKADILVYGMGEKQVVEVFNRFKTGDPLDNIPGTAQLLGKKAAEAFIPGDKYLKLPSYKEHQENKDALLESTRTMELEMNPESGRGLFQRYGDRLVVVEPPAPTLSSDEFDRIYMLPYAGCPHPSYREDIPAFTIVKDSITVVRGCPGGCAFCSLCLHQGREVRSRGIDSVISEIERLKKRKHFKGIVSDLGGPGGNLFGIRRRNRERCRKCRRASCCYPDICSNLDVTQDELVKLFRRVRDIPGIRHAFISSGVRLDLALRQPKALREMIRHHVPGQLKVAPEHLHPKVLKLMRKNKPEDFYEFMRVFYDESRKCGKEQYLIPLFISNFPGCTAEDMAVVDKFLSDNNWKPQQVQDFIPLPGTAAAAMYYAGKTLDGHPIHVNRGLKERRPQIKVLKRGKKKHPYRKYRGKK